MILPEATLYATLAALLKEVEVLPTPVRNCGVPVVSTSPVVLVRANPLTEMPLGLKDYRRMRVDSKRHAEAALTLKA